MCVGTKTAAAVFLLAALAVVPAVGQEFTQRLTNEVEININDVSGAGAAQSSLNEGFNISNNIQLNQGQDSGARPYFLNLGGRGTDDRTVDLKPLSLTNLQLRMGNGSNQWTIGDTFEYFSQYTLSSSLKGVAYSINKDAITQPSFTLVYGVGYPRWDSIYGSGPVRSVRRQAYGVRSARQISDAWTVGAQILQLHDSKRINDGDPLYKGPVYGIDWQYKPFEGLSLTGESAFSSTDENTGLPGGSSSHNGSAHRIVFDGQGDNLRLLLEYERVSPGFVSVLGSATSDRERIRARWRQKNGRDTTMNIGMLWFRDNLSNQKANTTNNYRPEISFSQRRLFNRVYGSGDITFRYDHSTGGGRKTDNRYLDLTYRDRFGEMDFDTRAGLINYKTNQGQRDSTEYTLNATFGTRKTIGSVIYRPQLYLGTWLAKDDLTNLEDRIYETSVGLGMDFPDSNISTNFKLGKHRLLKDGGDDNDRVFGNLSVFWRLPEAGGGISQQMLFFRYGVNQYTNTDTTRDFTEHTASLGVNFEY